MKQIIYCANADSNPYHFECIDKLKELENWKPVIINFPDPLSNIAKERYPETFVTDSMKIRQGIFEGLDEKDYLPLEKNILDDLKIFQTRYFDTLEDTTGWNYSFKERQENFFEVFKYWYSVIKKVKPDIFVGFNWPHTSSDYSLYLIAKYHFKIPTLFITPIPFFRKSLYSIGTSMENSSETFKNNYLSNNHEVSNFVKEYIKNFKKNSEIPVYQDKYYNSLKEKNDYFFLHFIKKILTFKIFDKVNLSLKKNTKNYKDPRSIVNIFEHNLLMKKKLINNMKTKKYYNQISISNIEDKNFIYFPAQYVPEPNAVIMLKTFENQLLILDMLNKAIPDDWKIYYKEHPATFLSTQLSAPFRQIEYLKKLKEFKKLRFIKSNFDTFELIKKSKATIGLGTAGWESLLLNKPTFVFDNIWYSICKSVVKIETVNDIKNAIKKIDNHSIDDDDIQSFMQAVLFETFESSIFSNKLEFKKINKEIIKEDYIKLASYFIKSYKKHYL